MQKIILVLAVVVAVALAGQERTQAAAADDNFHVTIEPYFMAPMFDGSVKADGNKSDVRFGFSELIHALDELRMYLGGRVEISKGKFALLYDGMYIKLKDEKNVTATGAPLKVNAKITTEYALQELAGAYQIGKWDIGGQGDKYSTLDIIVGARQVYLRGDADVVATLDHPVFGRLVKSGSNSTTRTWVNPFIGGRLSYPLCERLVFNLRADVGGFGLESDFTWNVIPELRYYFTKNKNGFMSAGFRAYGDHHDKKDFDYNLINYGPIISAGFRF